MDILQQYVRGVMSCANHHAAGVTGLALTIIGGIIGRYDQGMLRVLLMPVCRRTCCGSSLMAGAHLPL